MNRRLTMRRVDALILAVAALAILSGGLVTAGISFTDGFEGATLDPFWSTRQDSGSVSLSNTQVHTGAQALQLSSTSGTGEKYIWVFHTFDQPVFGDVSVWMYDTGANEASSNYLGLELWNSVLDQGAALYTRDYDLGYPEGGGDYRWNCSGASGYSVDRTKEWHHFTVSFTPQQIVLAIDGQVVHSAAGGTPFDRVQLRMEGPTWRPAWVCYYDDFSFQEYTATVPRAPIANAGIDQTVEQTSATGTEVQLDGSASSDPDGDALTYEWTWGDQTASGATPIVTLPPGLTTITLTVSDGQLTGTDTVNVTVRDTTPTTISSVTASPSVLWPANHNITSVTSSEPDNGLGDGDTAGDIQITGDLTVSLRAERSGKGNGRTYTITVECKDAAGNASTSTTTVTVPRDQGKK